MGDFVHLHLHTQYSLLDGANKISEVVKLAAELNQPAIAMTDHGNMHGAIEFYREAKKVGIKPIIGCELYVAAESRFDRNRETRIYHLTALATSLEGYRNLCKLSSFAFKEGFYFKPRVDHELLAQYSAGIALLSGCLSGEFNAYVSRGDREGAKKTVEFFLKHFPERFYLEVQPHELKQQQALNAGCIDVAKEMGIPLVATTDCHYSSKDDHFAQEVLMCISTGKLVTDPDRMRHEGVELYLKNYAQMLEGFGNASWAEEALSNTLRIAETADVKLDFNTYYMPQPTFEGEKSNDDRMAEMARAGLERRFQTLAATNDQFSEADRQKYRERLEEEIALIKKMGFPGYMLVVADFIVWAKEHGIAVGPGRGSCAGCLVAYALRITEVDPIANKLLFERFLNPDRISLPDIDVDFCIYGRDRVIQYVVEKYGKDRVAQIATFGKLKAKAAIKDVGRALGMSFAETDKIAELVPAPRQGFDYPLTEAMKMEPRLAQYSETPEGSKLISLALRLEGLTRHSSTHAAGVVIADRPLVELLPMMVDKEGQDVTQFAMGDVEKIGLVKFDFLGLKTLSVIDTALKIIQESRGRTIELETLPLNDPRTYSLLCGGNTTGVFQLESSGITEMTMRLKPNSFDDLVAILALYRPGPLDAGMVDHYIARKHGREQVTYLYPRMKLILSDTYGIMIYQEQIMQLARELAGFSLAEADHLRKAMGKKNPEEMAKQRDHFMKGSLAKGISDRLAAEIFDQMETFARYGFNRSHSVAYAMISFQTAYLKAHYGVEFMAALMTHETDDSDKILKNLSECRRQKFEVLPPDLNKSLSGFAVQDGKIRYGLEAVKGIGDKVVEAVLSERKENGEFSDLEDFARRLDSKTLNKRAYENLIKCGAFDFDGRTRRDLLEKLDDSLKRISAEHRDRNSSQISLFGAIPAASLPQKNQPPLPEWPINKKLGFEREALGFYISGHPLEKFRRELEKQGVLSTVDVRSKGKSSQIRVAGVITTLRLKNTKKGDRYASFRLQDYRGEVEALVWPDTYQKYEALLVGDEPLLATGRADVTEERCNLIVESLESLVAMRDQKATYGLLSLGATDNISSQAEQLLSIFNRFAGNCPVKVSLDLEKEEVSFVLKTEQEAPVMVSPSEQLCEEVEQLFGRPVLFFYS